MRIAFYKGWGHGTAIDRVVCLMTFSKYSHCELVFSDGVCASSSLRDNGVRFKSIDLESGHWDVYDLQIRASDEDLIRAYFNLREGMRFDLLGAIFSWAWPRVWPKKVFSCARVCTEVLQIGSVRSPGSLFHKLIDNHMI